LGPAAFRAVAFFAALGALAVTFLAFGAVLADSAAFFVGGFAFFFAVSLLAATEATLFADPLLGASGFGSDFGAAFASRNAAHLFLLARAIRRRPAALNRRLVLAGEAWSLVFLALPVPNSCSNLSINSSKRWRS
jgi:hypothetical protein